MVRRRLSSSAMEAINLEAQPSKATLQAICPEPASIRRLAIFHAFCWALIALALSLCSILDSLGLVHWLSYLDVKNGFLRELYWPLFLIIAWAVGIIGHANLSLILVPWGAFLIGGLWLGLAAFLLTPPAYGCLFILAGLFIQRLSARSRRLLSRLSCLCQAPSCWLSVLQWPLPWVLAPLALAWDLTGEFNIMILVNGMFPASTLLRWAGGSPNDERRARDPETRKLIVMLHGLGGQEGQYCMGRVHLALADSHTPLPPAVSVNYHTEGAFWTGFRADQNIKSFTENVARELQPYAPGNKGENLGDVELIFMGHSCGCVVANSFAQNHAQRMGFTVQLIVACSGPLQGSNLLSFALDGPWLVKKLAKLFSPDLSKKAIMQDICLGSQALAELREGMQEMQSKGLQCRCVTGALDPLVRPWSAAYNGTDHGHDDLVAFLHCGHFNNATSLATWKVQIAWILAHCQ